MLKVFWEGKDQEVRKDHGFLLPPLRGHRRTGCSPAKPKGAPFSFLVFTLVKSPITTQTVTLGRDHSLPSFRIDDARCSKRHLELRFERDKNHVILNSVCESNLNQSSLILFLIFCNKIVRRQPIGSAKTGNREKEEGRP